MTAKVLLAMDEVGRARASLAGRGYSCLDLAVGRVALWQRLRGVQPPRLGDELKSWDVLQTVEFLEREYPRSARVLDIGAYNSEILPILHRAGYAHLTGVDLNPGVRRMPYANAISYQVGDFLQAPFPDASFDAITAISVIEHGFDAPALLAEISRLLAPGGCFIASVDYWPEKIDTTDTKFFGMDWRIFSRQELEEFIAAAAAFGLVPEGERHLDAGERPIHCAGRDYTFAWFVLRRR